MSSIDEIPATGADGLARRGSMTDVTRTVGALLDSGVCVVGVAGGTGSGKSTLTKAIMDRLGEEHVSLMQHDWYYKDLSHMEPAERAQQNFDHPDSLETTLMAEHLDALIAGRDVDAPTYDFSTHTRAAATQRVPARRVILVDGILIFNDPALRERMTIKIFVDTEADTRFIRRLKRDMAERGRTAESVIEQYETTVRPMHEAFVEPTKRFADMIIPFGINQVALDLLLSRLRPAPSS